MPRAQLDEMQLERLQTTCELAYEHAPLIRERWDEAKVKPSDIKTVDDFRERVPFIDKDAIREFREARGDPFGGLLCLPIADLTGINSTSGTTGNPTLTAERWGEDPRRPNAMARDLWHMGGRPGDYFSVILFTFPGPFYTLPLTLGMTPVIYDYDVHEVERLMRQSLRYRPTLLYNLGGVLISTVADVAARTGLDPKDCFASYRGIVWAGEPLGTRARTLAELWGLPLYQHSTAGDASPCFECSERDGMHVWEDTALVEGIDPHAYDHRDATPVTARRERCELVATALSDFVAPLVRYRSDDLVQLDREPCPCGRTHVRLWTVGRKGDEVVVDGQSVMPIDVWSAVEEVEPCRLGLFQIVRPRRELDVLRLRVGYDDVGDDRLGALADEIRAVVSAAVGIEPEVELVRNEVLLRQGPPHKIPRVTKT